MSTDEPSGDDTSPVCSVTFDDLSLSEAALEQLDLTDWECSRPVWDDAGGEHCVWHADADTTPKPPGELGATVADGDLHGAIIPNVEFTDGAIDLPDGPGLAAATLADAELTAADLTDATLRGANLTSANLNRATLTSADLANADLTDARLYNADLTDATLRGASLTEARLLGADLDGAHLYNANLDDAHLYDADLTNATLVDADLTNARLRDTALTDADLDDADLTDADLTGANLRGADLSEKDLSGVNLSRADLRDVDMIGMSANQATTVGRICTGLSHPDEYDQLAQAYHEFKEALSQEGLSQRARQARALEQQARTAEARERFKHQAVLRAIPLGTRTRWRQWLFPPWPGSEIRTQFLSWIGGTLSRVLTGYGTRPLYVLMWTAAIILGTTALFALGPTPADGWDGGPLYYSVVTFVTAPPEPPGEVGSITRAAILLETYLGTALIVLLGYVLGTREQV